MKKIDTDGLAALIDNISVMNTQLDSLNELTQILVRIQRHIQTQSSVTLDELQNQLS
jgi:hypothetical protein